MQEQRLCQNRHDGWETDPVWVYIQRFFHKSYSVLHQRSAIICWLLKTIPLLLSAALDVMMSQ